MLGLSPTRNGPAGRRVVPGQVVEVVPVTVSATSESESRARAGRGPVQAILVTSHGAPAGRHSRQTRLGGIVTVLIIGSTADSPGL